MLAMVLWRLFFECMQREGRVVLFVLSCVNECVALVCCDVIYLQVSIDAVSFRRTGIFNCMNKHLSHWCCLSMTSWP